MDMPLLIVITTINELQPGTSEAVSSRSQKLSTYPISTAVNSRNNAPIKRPSRRGARENENIPSAANRIILRNEYFDLPAIRSSGTKGRTTDGNPIHC